MEWWATVSWIIVALVAGVAAGAVAGIRHERRASMSLMHDALRLGRERGLREARNEARILRRFGLPIPSALD